MNLTKIFPWLSIRNKLLIAFVGLSVLPVAFVGIYGVVSNAEMMETIAFENLQHDVHTIREKTSNFLSAIESDLRVVQNSFHLDQLVRVMSDGSDERIVRETIERINAELLAFARTKKIYFQIRMINENGAELFRIENDHLTDSTRTYRSVSPAELHHRGERYYFLLMRDLQPDQIAVAAAELVRGENERVPVLSFAMPVMGPKGRVGVLISNVFARDLFRLLEPTRHYGPEGNVVLVSGDGYYLFHSQKKNAWNKLLAAREEDNLKHEYPADVASTLVSGKDGILTVGDEIIAYGPLFPARATGNSEESAYGLAVPLFVFEGVPKDAIMGPVRSLSRTLGVFLLMFLAVAIGLGLLATRQFTKPISELQRGSEIISKGNYQHRLQIETRDEIESLAEQFNVMAESLEKHENALQHHRANLEEMVSQRTRELFDEKSKLQAILDNVPSAFVLLNKDLKIQSASAAFTVITGKRLEEVRGLDCRTVFCSGGFCKNCLCEEALKTRSTKSHVDVSRKRKSGERYIEHIAVPLRENGEFTSVLEIITDVTSRKRLEQDLVRAEKLTAAGEMSAIIAHEFRNRLTSIKMILQLQREGKHLNRADKRSLTVALNSLYQMEGVVNELLNYARPSPMEFRTANLGDIIEECLEFVQLQAAAQNITLTKQIHPKLPPMWLDTSRWKEAINNILLNAIQAIASKSSPSTHERIVVKAKPVILPRKVQDLGGMRMDGNDVGGHAGSGRAGITLSKGSRCMMIEISDTGPGIDRLVLRRMFDPFFTTKVNGTGLGLPLVKRTINAHGGVVSVESNLRAGATFRIHVPASEQRSSDQPKRM